MTWCVIIKETITTVADKDLYMNTKYRQLHQQTQIEYHYQRRTSRQATQWNVADLMRNDLY